MLERPLHRLSPLGTREIDAPAVIVERSDLRVVEELFPAISSVRASRKAGDVAALLSQCARLEPRAWLAIGVSDLPRAEGLQIVDVSDRFASFRISGDAAGDLFAAALSAPLQALTAGRAMRAKFAEECEVIVQQLSDAPEYRLLIDAPLAHFAADWIRDFAT